MRNSPGKKTWGLPRDTKSLKNLHTKQINLSTGQLDKSTGQLDNFNETLQLVKAIARHFAASQDPLAK